MMIARQCVSSGLHSNIMMQAILRRIALPNGPEVQQKFLDERVSVSECVCVCVRAHKHVILSMLLLRHVGHPPSCTLSYGQTADCTWSDNHW